MVYGSNGLQSGLHEAGVLSKTAALFLSWAYITASMLDDISSAFSGRMGLDLPGLGIALICAILYFNRRDDVVWKLAIILLLKDVFFPGLGNIQAGDTAFVLIFLLIILFLSVFLVASISVTVFLAGRMAELLVMRRIVREKTFRSPAYVLSQISIFVPFLLAFLGLMSLAYNAGIRAGGLAIAFCMFGFFTFILYVNARATFTGLFRL